MGSKGLAGFSQWELRGESRAEHALVDTKQHSEGVGGSTSCMSSDEPMEAEDESRAMPAPVYPR